MERRSAYGMIGTGVLAPVVVLSASCSWLEVLVAAAIAVAYLGIVAVLDWRTEMDIPQVLEMWGLWGKIIAWIALLGNVVLLSYASAMSLRAFPMEGAFPLYPVTLLILATWISAKGKDTVGRFGGALCIFVVVPLAIVLAFGAVELNGVTVVPTIYIDSILPLASLALVGGSSLWLRRTGKGSPWPWLLGILGFGFAVALVTVGDLGLEQAKTVEEPFYAMTKSISLFGVMERMEVLVASVLLLGFGVFLSYLALVGREIATVAAGKSLGVAQCAMAILLLGLLPTLPSWFLLVTITICWGVIPVIALGIVRLKKYQGFCK